jgi:general secretion pathway protein C
MIWLFKRYFWVVNLLIITAVAYFCSDIFLHLIEGRLNLSISPGATSQAKKESKEDILPESHYMSILERNLFDPSGRGKKDKTKSTAPAAAIQPVPKDIEATSEKMALRGTVIPVRSDRPDPDKTQGGADARYRLEARAIIEDLSTRSQSLYSINQQLGDRKIVAIKRSEVIFARPDGSLERLKMEFDKLSRPGAASFVPKMIPGPLPSSPVAEKVSANSYEVSREELMKNVQNMSQFMTQLRVRPHFQNGQPDGFLITDIRAGSVVEQIGLANGDILKSINGRTITRPDELFQAYQQLQHESTIQLEVERKGETQNFSYTIR